MGIGGIGMSAIAMVLRKKGFSISGSDLKQNNAIKELEKNGAQIFYNQQAENIHKLCDSTKTLPTIVVSTAIPKANLELLEAEKLGLSILHRSDVLASLISNQESILVAGSHGKTTTSTIISTLLKISQQDPTAIIGGIVPIFNSNYHIGKGKFLVAEADESDGTLTKFKGTIGIITNIELDHTDYYKNLDSLKDTMNIFSKNCNQTIANYDCKNLRDYKHCNTIWYSRKIIKGMHFSAIPICTNEKELIVDYYENEQFISKLKMPLPGLHNLSNTLAAISACRIAGLTFNDLKKNLQYIKSPKRRFEFKGLWKGRRIIDDYAHHPSEIDATISTARLVESNQNDGITTFTKKLVVIFQPHRYSRTKDLLNDFAISLGKADKVFLTQIYSAGEKKIKGIDTQKLARLIRKKYENIPVYSCDNFIELEKVLENKTSNDDMLIFMGAGDIDKFSEKLVNSNQTNKLKSTNCAA
ncbi:UDP-N-acetylmuramate--L-alanine ligase [Prochlorococcus sp. MIT 0601]|uniref:UDP-N-acetylmuramate--L-alanine ligase n=1 Tax=Prochlorococcus sp. MIT 0601 TaxID=1499498 RepID=UPI0023AA1326|nr:UDP-N-acetylmuramate--L-alanine ligase [Prochlorococcus sp. MIT 0601]